MKYILYRDYASGFGNQLRSFLSYYMLSQVMGRELLVSNFFIKNGFNCPWGEWDKQLPKDITRCELHLKGEEEYDYFKTSKCLDITEDVIETQGNQEFGIYLSRKGLWAYDKLSTFFKDGEQYKEYIERITREIFNSPTDKLLNLAKKNIDYDETEYCTVQFRSFFDVNFLVPGHDINMLDLFDPFMEWILSKKITTKNIFVTSDHIPLVHKMKNILTENGYTVTLSSINHPEKGHTRVRGMNHTGFNKNLEALADWATIGKSHRIYSTRTSFSQSAASIFGTPLISFKII